jgi:hypothetical protein
VRPLLAAIVLTTGCRGLVELVERDPAADEEETVDAAPPPGCEAWSFVPVGIDVCAVPAPDGALTLTAGTWHYDTNSGALTDPTQNAIFPPSALATTVDGTELRVLSVASLRIDDGAVLVLRGKRPLLALAWSRAELLGTIDATSRVDGSGAGADPDACDAVRATPGTDDAEGAGGGGGGGLGLGGAAGGKGNDGLTAAGTGGAAASSPVGLRGGCDGARGGNTLAGEGGSGGGAFAIAARDVVDVSGVLLAGGGGGGAARGGRSGGGGGGSGGVILLAAPSVHLASTAVLAANGGGGGGGSDGTPASRGQDALASAVVAPGGAGQGMGGAGGAGGAGTTGALAGTSPRRGGGGGGGGVGVIVLDAPAPAIDSGAIVSPPP